MLRVSKKRIAAAVSIIAILSTVLYFRESLVADTFLTENLVELFIVVLTTFTVVSIVRIALVSSYRRRLKLEPGEQDNFVIGIDSLANLIIVGVSLASLLPIFGVSFTQFLTSLSLFAVALAWLFKEYFTNFFDSFRLMFSTEFRLGDYVKINDTTKGVITDITFRATKMKTDEGDVLFVPNTTLMNTEVVNLSKAKYKRIIVPFSLPTWCIGDVAELEAILTAEVDELCGEQIDRGRNFLRLTGVESGQTHCAYEVSINAYSFAIEGKVKRAVYERVVDYNRRCIETAGHGPTTPVGIGR